MMGLGGVLYYLVIAVGVGALALIMVALLLMVLPIAYALHGIRRLMGMPANLYFAQAWKPIKERPGDNEAILPERAE